MAFHLYLLGSFRLESRKPHGTAGREARTIRLPTRKAESLLAYLALFPERHVREKLASLFWGIQPTRKRVTRSAPRY
jgi:DNA-binding SARP family transcriptional activator